MDKDKIKKALETVKHQAEMAMTDAVMAVEGNLINKQLMDANSLDAGLSKIAPPVVLDDGIVIDVPSGNAEAVKKEIEEAENEQRRKRMEYEKDKTFFEQNVLKKTRSLYEIDEDFVKVLHPYYREKFIDGIRKWGTVAASIKYMKDNHGLKLRGDVLRRISTLVPAFKQEIDDAMDEYQAMIHMEMQRRAIEGVDKGVWFQGECVGTEKVYSDSLLVKMADTYNPEYKEAKQKDTSNGNTINVQIIKDFHNYKD